MIMVFNATFNNISVTSWLSVLLVEDWIFNEFVTLTKIFNKLNCTGFT